ncbi:hypothetical protein T09_14116 [Trichinella sp. T9]|nr:hypothetical protein T09_14116 [Trichinella sp. T9]
MQLPVYFFRVIISTLSMLKFDNLLLHQRCTSSIFCGKIFPLATTQYQASNKVDMLNDHEIETICKKICRYFCFYFQTHYYKRFAMIKQFGFFFPRSFRVRTATANAAASLFVS